MTSIWSFLQGQQLPEDFDRDSSGYAGEFDDLKTRELAEELKDPLVRRVTVVIENPTVLPSGVLYGKHRTLRRALKAASSGLISNPCSSTLEDPVEPCVG